LKAFYLTVALAALYAAPKIAEKFRNDRAIAADIVLQPGESETVSGNLPYVAVYFGDGSIEVTPSGGKPEKLRVKRGGIRYGAEGPRVIKNTGAGDLHYVRVDFPGSGSSESWGNSGLAPSYKLLVENRYARVYDIRIPAHTNEPQHSHHDRVVVCPSGAKLEHLYPDGRREPSTLATGEVAWRRGGTHIGQTSAKPISG
jgi:hypothetical protein